MSLDVIDHLLIDYLCDFPAKVSQLSSPEAGLIFNKPHHCLSASEIISRLTKLENCGLLELRNGEAFLSVDGGREWEDFFQPNWDKYILLESFYRFNGEFVKFGCVSFSELNEFLSGVSPSSVSIASIRAMEGWLPKYWKRLSMGYQAFGSVLDASALDEKYVSFCSSWRRCWDGAIPTGNLSII